MRTLAGPISLLALLGIATACTQQGGRDGSGSGYTGFPGGDDDDVTASDGSDGTAGTAGDGATEAGSADASDDDPSGPGVKFEAAGSGGQLLGGWAPGSPGGDFPAGTGIRVKAGSKLIVQMHYNTLELRDDIADQSTIELKIDDSVDKEAIAQFFTNPYWVRGGMPIRAGEKDASHAFEWDLTTLVGGRTINVYTANLHMHRLGTSARLAVTHPNGQKTCLLDIPRWDFDWQRSYALKKPVTMKPGDKLSIRCNWDNSAANQPVIDGKRAEPRKVNWGEGTADEMCLGSVLLTYGD